MVPLGCHRKNVAMVSESQRPLAIRGVGTAMDACPLCHTSPLVQDSLGFKTVETQCSPRQVDFTVWEHRTNGPY